MTVFSIPYTSHEQPEMVNDLVEAVDEQSARTIMTSRLKTAGHTLFVVYSPTRVESPRRVGE